MHLAVASLHASWVEHFDWLEPLFEERLAISGGRMQVPDRHGLGFTLSEQAQARTVDRVRIDAPSTP